VTAWAGLTVFLHFTRKSIDFDINIIEMQGGLNDSVHREIIYDH
jgi:hypothetical protein